VEQFLNSALIVNGGLTTSALRLCGALASSVTGSIFLEEKGFFKVIATFLPSANEEESRLAIMVFATASASYPLSESMVAAIPFFFTQIGASWDDFQWIFIANICLNRQGAIKCAERFSSLVEKLSTMVIEMRFRVLTALERIVSVRETSKLLDLDVLLNLIQETKGLLGSDFGGLVVKIYEHISGWSIGRKALNERDFRATLLAMVKNGPSDQQPGLLKVLGQISHRK
jgi:hypothetical protein